jgi:hypothetical protein
VRPVPRSTHSLGISVHRTSVRCELFASVVCTPPAEWCGAARACRYMLAYVQCQMCKSFDTILNKDSVTRLTFIECQRCQARKSVSNVEKGFHATNRADRKAIKAAK